MVTVTLASGTEQQVAGDEFAFEGQCLLVISGEDQVAAFAPGTWQSVVVVPS